MTAPATTAGVFYGIVSDTGLASGALTDAQLTELSDTPPPVSTRDRGWYRAASKVRVACKSERQSVFPAPRALATFPGTGSSASQFVRPGTAGQRFSVRLMSVEAGRPFAVESVRMTFEDLERGDEFSVTVPMFRGGMDRSKPPGHIDATKAWNLLNASFQGDEFRSRRGFSVVNNESDDVEAKPSAIYDATNAKGDTYWLVLIAGTLYSIDNGELIELDTDWPQDELPTVATVGLKTFIASKSRVRVFQEGTIYEPGIDAPTDAPIYVTNTPNVTGGVQAISPGYEYIYCFYDGTRLTESGPSGLTFVELPPGTSPSSLAFTVGVSASSTVSERRLYRRKRGTSTWFLVATVADNTTTDVVDAAEVPPDINATLESTVDGSFITADFPDGAAVSTVEGRLIVFRDQADMRTWAISEVGDGERWHSANSITTEGEGRAAVTHEGRLVLFTDRTVEVVEGDWVRGSAGTLGIQRRVLDYSKGCFGPFAACSARGRVFFADASGIHVLGAGFVLKDVTNTISDEVQEIVVAAVDTAGSGVVMEFNYVSQELCVLLSQATGEVSDPKNRVMLTINLESGAWSVWNRPFSFIRKVFDGLLGPRMLACDYFGNVLEVDVYNGDGIQGNESWLPADAAITDFDEAAKTVTIAGASFPGTLRGAAIVLEDVSNTDDADAKFFSTTILADAGEVLTLAEFPTWALTAFEAAVTGPPAVAAIPGDIAWIGGILSLIDTKEFDGGRATRKKLLKVEVALADCTQGRF